MAEEVAGARAPFIPKPLLLTEFVQKNVSHGVGDPSLQMIHHMCVFMSPSLVPELDTDLSVSMCRTGTRFQFVKVKLA